MTARKRLKKQWSLCLRLSENEAVIEQYLAEGGNLNVYVQAALSKLKARSHSAIAIAIVTSVKRAYSISISVYRYLSVETTIDNNIQILWRHRCRFVEIQS